MAALNNLENGEHKIYQGDIFSGIIMHIVNENEFYVLKSESAAILIEMEEHMERNKLAKMFWYPVEFEKFVVSRNGEFFRARRVPLQDQSKNPREFMQIMLIDTGEMYLLPLASIQTKNSIFVIPEAFEDIPPLAKKCKWIEEIAFDRKTYLNDKLKNTILTFEAINVEGETVYVKIYPYDEGNNLDIDSLAENLSENLEIADTSDIDEIDEKPTSVVQSNNFISSTVKQPENQVMPSSSPQSNKDEGILLYKEDFNTISVQKYYEIKITSMNKLNKFIFRFNDPDYEKKFEKIQEMINDKKESKNYKMLGTQPEIGQLVIVKVDGQFRRAKIYDNFNENYVVWCLDDGSLKVAKKTMMYDWEKRFENVKYLTHEMEMVNISPIRASKRAMMRIFDFDENAGPLRSLMTQTEPSFKCRLFDQKGTDIAEILIQEGYANKQED